MIKFFTFLIASILITAPISAYYRGFDTVIGAAVLSYLLACSFLLFVTYMAWDCNRMEKRMLVMAKISKELSRK